MQKYINEITRLNGRGEAGNLLDNLDYFEGMDCNQIAKLYLDNGAGQAVAKRLYKLHDLTLDTAKHFIKRGVSDSIICNLDSFSEKDRGEVKKLVTNSR